MSFRYAAFIVLAFAGCSSGRSDGGDSTGTAKGPSSSSADKDGDGYSPAQGDCDDTNPLVGPADFDIPGNGIDDDCDGSVDNTIVCDTTIVGQNTPPALAAAMGLCSAHFLTATMMDGPSVSPARNTVPSFGVLNPLEGNGMAFISTGDATTDSSYSPQPGTDLGQVSEPSSFPYLSLDLNSAACGDDNPDALNDYTDLEVDLTVPLNANSFSFESQFFSAEYPEYVCQGYNDRFLVVLDDGVNTPQQVEYDMQKNPVTVNNSFFTVCQNDNASPATQHCTTPVSAIAGTGYDVSDGDSLDGNEPVGGSTGWLTTTVPAVPGNKYKLHFIVFDEGDGIYDSAALIDNFKWLTGQLTTATTMPIQ